MTPFREMSREKQEDYGRLLYRENGSFYENEVFPSAEDREREQAKSGGFHVVGEEFIREKNIGYTLIISQRSQITGNLVRIHAGQDGIISEVYR